MALFSKNLSYKLVPDKQFVSYETLNAYVKKIYQKLHVRSR